MKKKFKVIGIDLAGSPKRKTGICLLSDNIILSCKIVYTDDEIFEYIKKHSPDLIAIDAPLNLPPGRKTLEERNGEHFRPCDRELLKRGIRFFPITLGPMRSLTKRGIALKTKLKRRKYSVIEIYPGAAQDIWKIPRKQYGLEKLLKGLRKLGIKGLTNKMNGDELDAVSGAVVGQLYLQSKAEVIGNLRKGAIVLPLSKINN